MSCSVGELKRVHYKPMSQKYAYHSMLFCLLGKYECKNLIREAFMEENNAVMTEHDYAEALKAEFYMEIKSGTFVFNRTLSI